MTILGLRRFFRRRLRPRRSQISDVRLMYIGTHPKMVRTLFRGQLKYMAERGFDVVLVLPPGPDLLEDAALEGVRVIPIPIERGISLGRDLRTLASLIRVMITESPDIVNAGAPKGGLLGMLAAFTTGVPVRIYLLRGLRMETVSGLKRHVLTLTERISSGCAHRVIAISASLRDIYVTLGLAPSEKIDLLGAGSSNGLMLSRFLRTEACMAHAEALRTDLALGPGPVLGFVGRVTRDKGGEELVQVFERVCQSHPNVSLVIVGMLEEGDAVPPHVKDTIRNHPRIVLTGFTNTPEHYYPMFDVLLFPTHREGFGNVALEASACRVPVVAFDVTGARDSVAHNVTGTLVPFPDVTAFTNAVCTYLDDPELCENHGRRGQQRVIEDFDQHQLWERWWTKYRRLLRDRGVIDLLGAEV